MLFRRFIQRFKQQQWGAIGTELVIVIIGVFIGIQVSNWNEEREIKQKAKVFTKRLTEDLAKEAWGYESLIVYNRQTNRNQRQVLDAMAGEIALSDEQFVISAYRATQYISNDRFRATYDELVSTGTISLIADEEMREAAIVMFTTPMLEQITQKGMDSEFRSLFRETVSAAVQEALLTRCGDRFVSVLDYATIEGMIDYPCTLELSNAKIQAAASALKSLPRLVPALQVRFADTQTALTDLQSTNRVALQTLRAIKDAKP